MQLSPIFIVLANLGRGAEARTLLDPWLAEYALGSGRSADTSLLSTVSEIAIGSGDLALLARLDEALALHMDRFATWGMIGMAMLRRSASGARPRHDGTCSGCDVHSGGNDGGRIGALRAAGDP